MATPSTLRRTIGLAIGLALIARPQQPELRIDTTEVDIPVSVTDGLNRPVHGLSKENFRIFDDNVEQTITSFANDDEDVAVGLVVDTSQSMGTRLSTSRWVVDRFLEFANPPDDFFPGGVRQQAAADDALDLGRPRQGNLQRFAACENRGAHRTVGCD